MNASETGRPFNLLRWFSLVSMTALLPVAGVTGAFMSHFLKDELLQRDASLTAQFVQTSMTVEGKHIGLGAGPTLAELMSPQSDLAAAGVSGEAVDIARRNALDHLSALPDVLLVNLFSRDKQIIWSSNERLIGTDDDDNDELAEAFSTRRGIVMHYSGTEGTKHEQKFVVQPKEYFIEYYIPLFSSTGDVVLVAEIYKEPRSFAAITLRGQQLVWGLTFCAGVLVYLGLFNIIRRGSRLLEQQQKQLAETDSLVYVGEMATALAHSLRSPLASVRSSAELVLITEGAPVRKYGQDIIAQVDFLSKWVRELLLYSRPLSAEPEPVDLVAVLKNVLDSFASTCAKTGVKVQWNCGDSYRPMVKGNTPLIRQALHSVISNAMEAMPAGGELRIDMRLAGDSRQVELTVADTGIGMSTQQLAMAFKPFHTTKRHGLGLGLPMLKRVLDRFGGAVAVASREDAGTQVRMQFRMN
jgi:two-component system sensor histidine kinase HydH